MSDSGDAGSEVESDPTPSHNRNPTGKNQHKECPPPNDESVSKLLREYDRRGITSRKILSKVLREEHGICISEATIARRRRALGLKGSRVTMKELSEVQTRQLVLEWEKIQWESKDQG